jgi:crossover junction endodeoxyribonuclease RuvC
VRRHPHRAAAPAAERLRQIYDGLGEVLARHAVDAMAVEGVFYGKNARTTVILGHARGAALLAATLRELPVFEYSPAEIKNAVAGTGRATKEQVQFMVQRLLRLRTPPAPADAADGVAVALCHCTVGVIAARIGLAPADRIRDAAGERVISRIRGTLLRRELGVAEVMTAAASPTSCRSRSPSSSGCRGGRGRRAAHVPGRARGRRRAVRLPRPRRARRVRRLLSASGVGPRLALNILSSMPPSASCAPSSTRTSRRCGRSRGSARRRRSGSRSSWPTASTTSPSRPPRRRAVRRARRGRQGARRARLLQRRRRGAVRKVIDEQGAHAAIDLIKAALAGIKKYWGVGRGDSAAQRPDQLVLRHPAAPLDVALLRDVVQLIARAAS